MYVKGIVSWYKQWLLLYLDLAYGEPQTNHVLNARVNDQLDHCLCLPLELLLIVAAANAYELKGEAVP